VEKKNKRVGCVFFVDTLYITLVVSSPPIGGMVFLSKCRVDVVDCSYESAGQSVYGNRLVSWDILIPAGVGLLVLLLVVVWPVVSDMPIYDGFLDVYMFCMLHVACYIYMKGITVIIMVKNMTFN
jgi:hypothetical protein